MYNGDAGERTLAAARAVTGPEPAEPQLQALMLRALDGDRPAYAALLAALGERLRAYFDRRLDAAHGDVEDLVQETLIAIHTKRHTFRRDQPLTPWVYGVARYKLMHHRRRRARLAAVALDEAAEVRDPQNPEPGAVRFDLERLLNLLPWRQRRLVAAVKLAGVSVAEAARRESMSEGAVKVSVHRGLRLMSEKVRHED